MHFGIIGWPLRHSLSASVHEAAYRALGLQASFVALPIKNGKGALQAGRTLGFRALAVTIPHKMLAARACVRLDRAAGILGAVNTVVFGPGGLLGYNTDVPSLQTALRSLKLGRGGPAVILGAGGAARAAALALKREGLVPIRIVARRPARARDILARVTPPSRRLVFAWRRQDMARALEGARVLVQATPLGMHPARPRSPVPHSLLRPDLAVCETIYNPEQTLLLRQARRRGSATIPGTVMFLEQALLQFRIMTGRRAPRGVMAKALRRALQ